jgi:hypothetical protein
MFVPEMVNLGSTRQAPFGHPLRVNPVTRRRVEVLEVRTRQVDRERLLVRVHLVQEDSMLVSGIDADIEPGTALLGATRPPVWPGVDGTARRSPVES